MTVLTREVGMICWMIIRSFRAEHTRDRAADLVDLDAQIVEHFGGEALLHAEKAQQNVLGPDVGMVRPFCLLLGSGQHSLGAVGEALERIHQALTMPVRGA